MPNTTPRNAQEAIGQANRYERAKQLLTDGYTFTHDAELNAVYVCKPGRLYAEYTIGEQLTGRDGCSCPDFQKTGNRCKHMLAWEIIQAEEEENAAMWDAICARYDEEEGWADVQTPAAAPVLTVRAVLEALQKRMVAGIEQAEAQLNTRGRYIVRASDHLRRQSQLECALEVIGEYWGRETCGQLNLTQ